MPGAGGRLGIGAVALAAIALAVLWRVLPAASPPLFDGICTADAYRHLGGAPAPVSATQSYPGTSFPPAEVQTTETPPQAQILMQGGTFTSPSQVTVSVTPEPPPAAAPAGQTQDGNAYRMTATAGGQAVIPQSAVTVSMRGTGASSALTLYVYAGGSWAPLRTFNLGCGYTFEAVSQKLGDFALFRAASGGGGGSSGSGFPVAAIVGGIVAVIIAGTIALARIGAQRRR